MIDHRRLKYGYDTDPPAHDLGPALMITKRLSEQPARAEELATDPLKSRRLKIDGRDRFRKHLEELELAAPLTTRPS